MPPARRPAAPAAHLPQLQRLVLPHQPPLRGPRVLLRAPQLPARPAAARSRVEGRADRLVLLKSGAQRAAARLDAALHLRFAGGGCP